MFVKESPVLVSEDDYGAGVNAAVVITYPAAAQGQRHIITGIAWSFDAAPAAAAALDILDGATVIFGVDVTAAGYNSVQFDPPKCGTVATLLTITLGAGGAGVTGRLSILGHWVDVA